MNVAFRVDASMQIGTGHLMRCLTLADVLSRRGTRVRFLSRHMPDHFRETLARRGYEFSPLAAAAPETRPADLPHSSWLGTSQSADAAAAILALSGRTWDWLIVDHYSLDERWENALRGTVRRIAGIDDIADRRHDCDVLVDQNLHPDMAARYRGKVPPQCRLLLGPRFALLREEFKLQRERVAPRTGAVRRMLISFGGVDRENHTGKALEAVAALNGAGIQVDVVVGAQHERRAQLESECSRLGFACHVQTSRMAELMAAADLGVGAGGGAVWERCCLGVPTLAIAVAENQSLQIADAATAGLLHAPDLQGDLAQFLQRHLAPLIQNSALRQLLSENGMRTVDGRGAERIANELGCSDIELRRAAAADSRKVFEWRNHPSIRAVSRSTQAIDWDSHRQWFAETLESAERLLLIGERAGAAVGVVRFDLSREEAEISIYLVPVGHEPGTGSELLRCAEDWLVANRPAVQGIRAQVVGGNQRSERLFTGAGYRRESTTFLKRLH